MKISGVFTAALKKLGLNPQVRGPDGRADRSGICFAGRSAYEIAVNGKKILGSAQLRKAHTVLQHGSLLLTVDYERHARCMKGKAAVNARALERKMTGLFHETGTVDLKWIIECIVDAFKEVFNSSVTIV